MQESARIHVRKLGPPSSPGESVPAVRRNWDKDVEVSESVGALPFSKEKTRRAIPVQLNIIAICNKQQFDLTKRCRCSSPST